MNNFKTGKNKSAQDMQDEIFRRMSAEKKIKMVSNFFELAKELNPQYFKYYGTEKTSYKHSPNTR